MAYCNPSVVYSLLKEQWLVEMPVTGLLLGQDREDTRLLTTKPLPIIIIIPTNGVGSKARATGAESYGAPIDAVELRYDFIINASNKDACWTLLSWVLTGLRQKMGRVTIETVDLDDQTKETVIQRGNQLMATLNITIYVPRYEPGAYSEALVESGTVAGTIVGIGD